VTEATVNGAASEVEAVPAPEFPVDSFREAASHLRRPFSPRAVKFKCQVVTENSAMIVAYIDARLVSERLNLVCPHLWFDDYEPVGTAGLLCRLTVGGITRQDVGSGYKGKGLYSDAFKRAAVKFGVGVPLYAMPAFWLSKEKGQVKIRKKTVDGRSKWTGELTPAGISFSRSRYAAWLEHEGEAAFGEVLDHGDAEDSVGDAEAATDDEAPPVPEEDALDQDRAANLLRGMQNIGVTKFRDLDTLLGAAGLDGLRAHSKKALDERIASLSDDEADQLEAEINRRADA
jgi:hypothetical protein